jgi:Mce-associated membrane protein
MENFTYEDHGSPMNSRVGGNPNRRRPVVAGTRRRGGTAIATPDLGIDEDLVDSDVESDAGADTDSAVVEPVEAGDEPDAESPALSKRLSVVLIVVALVVAAAGTWLTIAAASHRAQAEANTAVVDNSTTAQAIGQVNEALEQVFSYKFDDTAVTEKAAADVLVGAAKDQYAKLFEQVRQQAPEQKLVLRSKVALSGVTMLSGDNATLLVFIDQSATRGDTNAGSSGAAQLRVSASRSDGRWRITELHTV